ncbi:MAG: glycoside hydrolase [Actinobacteria bacterium]|nr:glycoside hydrolase [Actinomycetota bacterium]
MASRVTVPADLTSIVNPTDQTQPQQVHHYQGTYTLQPGGGSGWEIASASVAEEPAAQRALADVADPTTLLRSYFDALNRREFARAYTYWDNLGQASQQTFAQFERGYAMTKQITVDLGTPQGNAGAGNLYADVPVTIIATQSDGSTRTYKGTYTAHRANIPPFDQLGWRIESAKVTATTAPPSAGPSPSPPAATSGSWIALSPDSGPTGTVVQISGFLPGGPSAAEAQKNLALGSANVCWGACPGGLNEQFLRVTWSPDQSGHFTMQFTVPATSWLEADGPHAPSPGDYLVGVQCLAPSPGFNPCGLQTAQASATFHLTGPAPPQSGLVAGLQLAPASGPPGTLVQVRGWAPLNQIDAGQPSGYSLVLENGGAASTYMPQLGQVQQALNGDLSGSFRVPQSIPSLGLLGPGGYTIALESILEEPQPSTAVTSPGITITPLNKGTFAERVTLAPTTFQVTAAPSWASLGQLHPLWIQTGGLDQPFFVDPTDPKRLAFCAPGAIDVSTDGGTTWATVPTAGVASVAATTDFSIFDSGSPPATCSAVALDPDRPESLYAAFPAFKKNEGAPPTFYVGYVTADNGRTWSPVPAPSGFTLGQFGGFQLSGHGVQASFGSAPSINVPATSKTNSAVEQTTDGGRSWTPFQPDCPAGGPCVRWGPLPSGIGSCAMHGYFQPIEISQDGGHTWSTPAWPSGANGCDSNDLVGLGPSTVALLSGNPATEGSYPLLLSHDGGQTWMVVALPPLPGQSDEPLPYSAYFLPNGALLAQPSGGGPWQLLSQGASNWCPVTDVPAQAEPGSLRAAGDRLWWLEGSNSPNSTPTPHGVRLDDVRCTR